MAAAKEQTLNSFVFNFVTPGQQLGRLMTYRLLGLPEVCCCRCCVCWPVCLYRCGHHALCVRLQPSQLSSPHSPLQDFIFQYRKGVEGVTAAQVLEAAQRHLHPQQHVVVVVGDAETVRPMLQGINAKVVPLYLESAGST